MPDDEEEADDEYCSAEEHYVDGLEASTGLVEHVIGGAGVLWEQPIFHDPLGTPPAAMFLNRSSRRFTIMSTIIVVNLLPLCALCTR